jgi:hypothetical protein
LGQLVPDDLAQASELRSSLRNVLDFGAQDGLPDEVRARVEALLSRLGGETFGERLQIAVSEYDFGGREKADAELAELAGAASEHARELE